MKAVTIAEEKFRVVGIMDGDCCPAIEFLRTGEADTRAARTGLIEMLKYVATAGLGNLPAAWSHEANKQLGVYEFIKGPLRLFYFKGADGELAICTSGVRKKTAKADKAAIAQAGRWRKEYLAAKQNGTYEVIDHEIE